MELKEFFTEKCFKNPKSPDFVESLEASSEVFRAPLPKEVNRKKFFTFVVLCLDPESELRKNVASLPQRKTLAAIAAGFHLDDNNRFNPVVESVLVGENETAARIMAEYCFLAAGLEFVVYTSYVRIFAEVVAMSFKADKAKDSVALISKLKQEIEESERKIFGGDEVSNMKKALYLSSKQVVLNIRPEDMVEKLEKGEALDEFNPYGNYKTNKLTYAGEGIKEE
jgi:hypothetical protein